MKTSIRADDTRLEVEFLECLLHTTGEFAGNIDLSMRLSESVSVQKLLDNLRLRLADGGDFLGVVGHQTIDRGFQVTIASELMPPGEVIPPETIPATAEVFWLKQNAKAPICQLKVQPVLSPIEAGAPDDSRFDPSESKGCALLFVLAAILLSRLLTP